MTFDDFKTRAMQGIPLALMMMPELEELGAKSISIRVNREWHVDFEILFDTECLMAYYIPHDDKSDDFFHVMQMAIDKSGNYRTIKEFSDHLMAVKNPPTDPE